MDPYLKAFGQVGAGAVHGVTCLVGSYVLGEWLEESVQTDYPIMEISVFIGVFLSMFSFVWMVMQLDKGSKGGRDES